MDKNNEIIKAANFPGRRSQEFVELYLRRHVWALLVPCFILGVIFLLLGFAIYYWWNVLHANLNIIQNEALMLMFYVLILTIIHLYFVKIINYILGIKIITNSRIINLRATALLNRESEMVELSRIQDLGVMQKGIIRRLLNFGSIVMHDASGQKIFTFSRIPKPHKKINAISHIYKKALSRQNMF